MREKPSCAAEALSGWIAERWRAAVLSAAALTLSMVLLGVYTARRGPLPGEDALYDRPLIPPFRGQAINDVSLALIGLGAPAVALGLVLVFALVLFGIGERAGAVLVMAVSAVAPLTAMLKPLFGEQPLQKLPPIAHYPSGHVAFVSAVFGMTALLAVAGRRRLLAACLVVPILGIGPAVLIGGGHVASDVAGGYLLAAAWILVVLVVTPRLDRDTRPAG